MERNNPLQDKYEATVKNIRECKAKDNGGSVAELEFGKAYQRLVQAGLARQIRKKYRSRW
jgi:hypothetical protein